MNLLHMKEQILKTKFINNKIKKFNTPVRSTSRAWMHRGFEGGAEISLKLKEFDKKGFVKKISVKISLFPEKLAFENIYLDKKIRNILFSPQ